VRGPHLLFFGDSHVAGVGDSSALGWAGRIAASAFAAGVPVTHYNLGVRGETSVEIASRLCVEALPRLAPGLDTRIVVSFGVNDTTQEGGRVRVEPASSLQSLQSILKDAHALGCPAMMVGPAPVDDPDQNERLAELSAACAAVCARHEVFYAAVLDELLPSRPWMRQVAAGDGAHPDADGYALLAEVVLSAGLLDWLRTPADCNSIVEQPRPNGTVSR
jgi:lysophospholipase L1-like esterase